MSTKEIIRKLKVIHVAMALFMALSATASYWYVTKYGAFAAGNSFILGYEVTAILLVFGLLLISMLAHRSLLKKVDKTQTLDEKMEDYLKLSIIQFGLIELMILCVLILFLLSGIHNIFLYAMLALVYFIYHRPHPLKFITDLQLSEEEGDQIRELF